MLAGMVPALRPVADFFESFSRRSRLVHGMAGVPGAGSLHYYLLANFIILDRALSRKFYYHLKALVKREWIARK